ncbi:hypothetical protein [Streptosporangium sp. NPDC000396]|uniref:hypothetical protein n=1 Tax=Streptosporangium sp. NPDC000396 TaxID=3366185 RepID=UPI00369D2C77
MHDDHYSTHRRSPSGRPRGRMPYGQPPGHPPAEVTDRPRDGQAHNSAGDPFVYGSRISVDIRPVWPPQPPRRLHRPSWSWPHIPRDRFLRPALIFGFLAAAGAGIWSSGWSPTFGRPAADTVAVPDPPWTAGDDAAIAPAETTTPSPGHALTIAPSAPSEKAASGQKPAEQLQARAATGIRDSQGVRRHGRRGAPKTAERPAVRTVTSAPPAAPDASETPATAPRTRPPASPGERTPPGARGNRTGADTPGTHAAPEPRTAPAAPDDRLSAAHACRHLQPGDWRYGYCVRAWNDFKRRNGLP